LRFTNAFFWSRIEGQELVIMTTAKLMPCVFVAEDEPMVSMLLEDLLDTAGYRVVLAANLAEGLTLATDETIDVAFLDITLGRQTSFPIAEKLHQRNIPFIFASGYGLEDVPEHFRDVQMLQKPYDMKGVLSALSGILGSRKP
jgi:DNA-binding response OmpR family regulator